MEIDAFIRPAIHSHAGRSTSQLIEIGCARSQWLPYFALNFGLAVTGLDYSPTGCDQERQILARAGVSGDVICANLFEPPEQMLGRFDMLWTNGVLEHFDDTAAALRAFTAFLKTGGLMITLIPNMRGLVGTVQRILGPSTYAIHVPLTRDELRNAHTAAGLQIVRCDYVMSVNFGVLAVSRSERLFSLRMLAVRVLRRLSVLVWMFERAFAKLPVSRAFSPYIICVATKST